MPQAATPIFGDETYDDVERAVMETPRGRWFLGEFARRIRAGETDTILAALARIERSVAGAQPLMPADAVAAPISALPVLAPIMPQDGPLNDTPIDALMARLNAALEETGRTMRAAEATPAHTPKPEPGMTPQSLGPETLDDIDAMSPPQRLEFFY